MNGITKLSLAATAAFVLAACGSSSTNDDDDVAVPPQPTPTTSLRVHHSVADAPDVNVLANGNAVLEAVPYGASSGVLSVDAGDYSLQVDGILPDGSVATVIGPADATFSQNTRYEIFAIGSAADGTIEPLIFANMDSEIDAGNARLQVVHASPAAPTVDIFLTAPDADLTAEAPAATLQFGDFTGQLDVPAGEYQVRITVAGDPAAVAYDSGAIELPDGADLVVAAVNNTATGASPVMLQIADGEGSMLLPDVNAGADIRVVHASADAPPVDVTVNNAASPAIAGLAFGSGTDFINLPAADYLIDVAAAGGTPVVIDDAPLSLATGDALSVYAVGALGDGSLTLAVVGDAQRRVATEAQVQLVHASPSAGNVDIYVTATDDISGASPAFADVPFDSTALVSTGYVSLLPGDYVVTVTAAGTQTAAIGPIPLTLEGGGIYTAVAVDSEGGGLPPGLILLDDLAQ